MISCKTRRKGIRFPLQEYHRQSDQNLPVLWKSVGFEPVSQSRALRDIEAFVDSVISSKEPAFVIHDDPALGSGAQITDTGRHLLKVLPLLGLFDSEHDYAEKPYAFLDACWLLENMHGIRLDRVWMNPHANLAGCGEDLNLLVDKIRMSSRQDWFRRGVSDRRYESKERAKRINSYLAYLLYRYSKLLLIRLNFGYAEEIRKGLTIDRLYADLKEFIFLKAFHPFFKHLKGYVWAVEDGKDKGPHIHVLLIFNGSLVREDITIGENIRRELWDQLITAGEGSSYNSNMHKERFAEVGVGMIHRKRAIECANAIFINTYLGKDPHHPDVEDPQYLRIKPEGVDAFGMGELSAKSSRAGRPPLVQPSWSPSDMVGIRWPDQRAAFLVKKERRWVMA